MLARGGAQIEQPGFDPVKHGRIMVQRLGRAGQPVFGLARLDHRAVQGGQRLAQQRMFARDPVQPPRRAAQGSQGRIRSGPQVLQFGEIA